MLGGARLVALPFVAPGALRGARCCSSSSRGLWQIFSRARGERIRLARARRGGRPGSTTRCCRRSHWIQRHASDLAAGHVAGPPAGARPAPLAVRQRLRAGRHARRRARRRRHRRRGAPRRAHRGRELSATAPLDEPLAQLVLAAREALVNAAKHSGSDEIAVYSETGPAEVAVFVRDRGAGFDRAQVASDRRGIAESTRRAWCVPAAVPPSLRRPARARRSS